jgi:hypothetical protein
MLEIHSGVECNLHRATEKELLSRVLNQKSIKPDVMIKSLIYSHCQLPYSLILIQSTCTDVFSAWRMIRPLRTHKAISMHNMILYFIIAVILIRMTLRPTAS